MSNSQWSKEQPPAWEGQKAPAYKPEAPTPTSGWTEQRTSVLLGLTWGLFSKNAKQFLLSNIVVVGAGALVALAFLRFFPIEISALSQALLNGDTKPLDDAINAAATVKAQTKIIVDAVMPLIQMYAITLPLLATTNIIASAFANKIALDNSDENSKSNFNWIKLITATLAAFSYAFVGFLPVLLITLFAPGLIFVGVVMVIPYFIWIGLGFSLLYPIVMAEDLGGYKAIKRSLVIVKNNRKTILVVSLIAGILASLPGAALNQFMLLIPPSVLNFVEVTSLASYAGMIISVPVTASALVILYRYLHAKYHN